MSNVEKFEPINPNFNLDEKELEQSVHQLGHLYGITGLEVTTISGEGA